MKTLSLTFDQSRRKIRRELFIERQLDNDHSEERLYRDARELDATLIELGYELIYKTEWCPYFNQKRQHIRAKTASGSPIDDWQNDLNSKDIS